MSEIAVWRSQWKRKSATTTVRPLRVSSWANPAPASAAAPSSPAPDPRATAFDGLDPDRFDLDAGRGPRAARVTRRRRAVSAVCVG